MILGPLKKAKKRHQEGCPPPAARRAAAPPKSRAPRAQGGVLRREAFSQGASIVAVSLALLLSSAALAQPASPSPVDTARALFEEASAKLDQRDYEHACPLLEKAITLEPNANGARFALAECYEGQGKLASALRTYRAVADADAAKGQIERQKKASDRADALASRVGSVIVQIPDTVRPPRPTLTLDGQAFSDSALGKPTPLDKGAHVLAATAAGKKPREIRFEIKDGATISVTIDALEDDAPPATTPDPKVAPDSNTTRPLPPRETPPVADAPDPPNLSHRGQLGAFGRIDFDALSLGAVAAVGLTYAPLDRLEIAASGLLGKRAGFEIDVDFFFLLGTVKPVVEVSLPVLFQADPYVGVRAAAGLQLDLNRHLGVRASIGGTYFPEVPKGYSHAALLPALGVQGRL